MIKLFNILVCEDDKNIRNLIGEYLKSENYQVFYSENGEDAIKVLEDNYIDLLITDVMMPKMDGFKLAKEIRESSYELPILMITAKEKLEDKKIGYRNGIDDYMVKPIEMDEMLLRVAALLRRAKIASEKKLVIGNTTLDYDKFTVNSNGVLQDLPKKEFMLIFKLLSQINCIFTRSQLMDEIWGYDTESDEQTVNVHISKLRERFMDNQDFEIVTVKGLGYKAVKL